MTKETEPTKHTPEIFLQLNRNTLNPGPVLAFGATKPDDIEMVLEAIKKKAIEHCEEHDIQAVNFSLMISESDENTNRL